jgi:hypothetical protein
MSVARNDLVRNKRKGVEARSLVTDGVFRGKGVSITLCRISVSISDREIRRIFGVCAKTVIERGDLRVRVIGARCIGSEISSSRAGD